MACVANAGAGICKCFQQGDESGRSLVQCITPRCTQSLSDQLSCGLNLLQQHDVPGSSAGADETPPNNNDDGMAPAPVGPEDAAICQLDMARQTMVACLGLPAHASSMECVANAGAGICGCLRESDSAGMSLVQCIGRRCAQTLSNQLGCGLNLDVPDARTYAGAAGNAPGSAALDDRHHPHQQVDGTVPSTASPPEPTPAPAPDVPKGCPVPEAQQAMVECLGRPEHAAAMACMANAGAGICGCLHESDEAGRSLVQCVTSPCAQALSDRLGCGLDLLPHRMDVDTGTPDSPLRQRLAAAKKERAAADLVRAAVDPIDSATAALCLVPEAQQTMVACLGRPEHAVSMECIANAGAGICGCLHETDQAGKELIRCITHQCAQALSDQLRCGLSLLPTLAADESQTTVRLRLREKLKAAQERHRTATPAASVDAAGTTDAAVPPDFASGDTHGSPGDMDADAFQKMVAQDMQRQEDAFQQYQHQHQQAASTNNTMGEGTPPPAPAGRQWRGWRQYLHEVSAYYNSGLRFLLAGQCAIRKCYRTMQQFTHARLHSRDVPFLLARL